MVCITLAGERRRSTTGKPVICVALLTRRDPGLGERVAARCSSSLRDASAGGLNAIALSLSPSVQRFRQGVRLMLMMQSRWVLYGLVTRGRMDATVGGRYVEQ
jgi:hypothetical protein